MSIMSGENSDESIMDKLTNTICFTFEWDCDFSFFQSSNLIRMDLPLLCTHSLCQTVCSVCLAL